MTKTLNHKPQTKNHKPIPLFYWSEIKFIFKDKENYGDLLSKYLVEKISGREVKWVHPKKQPWYKWDKTNYITIGSVIHHASKNSIVWGSGIIDKEQNIIEADYRAVRGPQTRKFLLGLGYKCPAVYGDPALLMPKYYQPAIKKNYKLGIIPHYHDFELAQIIFKDISEVLVIDLMTFNIEEVTSSILSCERTLSSSLHGLIVSHAYGIPSIWVQFSDKIFGDGIKYQDYLESIEMQFYSPVFIKEKLNFKDVDDLFNRYPNLPAKGKIEKISKELLDVCPFKN